MGPPLGLRAYQPRNRITDRLPYPPCRESGVGEPFKGLATGRAQPGGGPFKYGLDGEPFDQQPGPANYPSAQALLRLSVTSLVGTLEAWTETFRTQLGWA